MIKMSILTWTYKFNIILIKISTCFLPRVRYVDSQEKQISKKSQEYSENNSNMACDGEG